MVNRRMCFRRLGHFVAGVLGIFYFGVDNPVSRAPIAFKISRRYQVFQGSLITPSRRVAKSSKLFCLVSLFGIISIDADYPVYLV